MSGQSAQLNAEWLTGLNGRLLDRVTGVSNALTAAERDDALSELLATAVAQLLVSAGKERTLLLIDSHRTVVAAITDGGQR